MRQRIFLVVAATVLLISCETSEDPITPPSQPPVSATYRTIITLQDTAMAVFHRLVAASADTQAAMDSVVRLFRADTSVAYAEAGTQGVAVEYRSGIRGGIFLDPEDEPEAPAWMKPDPLRLPDITPRTKRLAFFNVHYNERKWYADSIMRGYTARLGKVGFGLTTVRLGNEVTLNRLMHLSDSAYGVVHLYSHGWAWPTKTAIQEVYLMTGERKTNTLVDTWLDELQAKQLMIAHVGAMGPVFFVSPAFMATYNNFRKDTTLVYGGFCYSNLGTWPSTMINTAGAGGYFGFDWKVRTRWNALWSVNLFKHLCDTLESTPWTIGRWHTSSSEMPKWYWNAEDNRNVHILLSGNQDLALRRLPPDTTVNRPSASFRISYIDYYFSCRTDSDRAYLGNWQYSFIKGSMASNVFTAVWADTIRSGSDTLWSRYTLRAKVPNRQVRADSITLTIDSKLYWGCTSRASFTVTNLPVFAVYGNSYEYKLTGLACAPLLALSSIETCPGSTCNTTIRRFNCRSDTILRFYITRYD